MAQSAPSVYVCNRGDKQQGQDQKGFKHADVKTPLECLAELSKKGLVTLDFIGNLFLDFANLLSL
jgi:hypothetical protein